MALEGFLIRNIFKDLQQSHNPHRLNPNHVGYQNLKF
jgi:hypothetical protein